MIRIVLLVLVISLISCSKKNENPNSFYTLEEFNALASETSLNNEKGEGELNFSDYSPGVNRLESKSLKYKRLAFFAVAFATEEQARNEALRLNQYYSRNWLFDRVEGEPVLEDYLIETFKAINPSRQIQRVVKKHAEKHGGEHSENHGDSHGTTESAHH